MNTFSAELLRFVGELRLAAVPVSVAETLDAMRAVGAAGFAHRALMREALAAALVKDEADRESFDEVFARFFGAFPVAGECRDECHVGEHGRPKQRVLGVLRGLERDNQAGLSLGGVLQVEEFDAAGQQAGFADRCRE